MKTIKSLKLGIAILFIISLSFVGCKKMNDYEPISKQDTSLLKATATGKIMSYNVNGNYRTSLICNLSNTVTLKVNVYTLGFYNIVSNQANGIQFSKSGEFKLKGIQNVILNGNGTPLVVGTNTFIVSFGGVSCTYKVVSVNNIAINQTSCSNIYTYMQVANHKTEKVWLDRNLGANRVAISAIDYQGYGSLYQWGRLNDGHQCVNWINAYSGIGLNGSTIIPSSTNIPGHFMYIKGFHPASDWRVPQNNMLWQGSNGANNPCPNGYRIPTQIEMNGEINSWDTKNTNGGYNSSLKWTVAGYREFYDGIIYDSGISGGVWTSTVINSSKSAILWLSTNEAFTLDDFRAEGYSVRCIKN